MDAEDRKATGAVDLVGLVPIGRSSRKHVYLVVMTGAEAGAIFRLGEDETVLGRSADCDIVLADDDASRRHARIVRRGPSELVLEDLGSTNGTYVGDERVDEARLVDGDRFQVASTLLKVYFGDELEETMQRSLFESSVRDGLTGLYNRRYLDTVIESEFSFARRHGHPLSLVLFDIDHFKSINDEHGHQVGDDVLRDVAEILMGSTRAEDVVARFGGEEYAVVARQTPLISGLRIAERSRGLVEGREMRSGPASVRVTLSAGVACFEQASYASPTDLVEAADAALYRAKSLGRNRVAVADGPRRGGGEAESLRDTDKEPLR